MAYIKAVLPCLFLAVARAFFFEFPEFHPMLYPGFFNQRPVQSQLGIPQRCTLHPNSGTQDPKYTQYLRRYFFNGTSGVCQPFAYNNNGGNQNNFLTEEDCLGTCFCVSPECFLPQVQGSCTQNITSFSYNRLTGNCQKFMYTGCHGNGNRFTSRGECNHVCKCSACIISRGHCGGFYYNSRSRNCRSLRRNHCAKQPGIFPSMGSCNRQCKRSKCKLPLDHGRYCQAYPDMYRFYFDPSARMCKRFVFDGCGGNENNFLSEDMCQMACGTQKKERPEVERVDKCSQVYCNSQHNGCDSQRNGCCEFK